MLIYDVLNKEKVYQIISNDLRNLGVKRRVKKQSATSKPNKLNTDNGQSFKKVFKTNLAHLPLDVVKLSSGAIIHVPQFVSQACAHIEKCITHEGLFRKAGSHLRQKEIIARLDAGGSLSEKYQVIDVANVLKTFFRDLPEPLIPRSYHDIFLRCALLKNSRVQALLMACILLPPHHLNTLAFLAEFLKKVAMHERHNKMGVDNLVKVVGPNIMPLQETTMSALQSRLETHLIIVKVLIENAELIGVLPDRAADLMTSETPGSLEHELDTSDSLLRTKNKKKKRRSGSLTRKPHLSASNLNLRMLNGLKKMVSKSGSPDAGAVANGVTLSDFNPAHTPSIKTGKKRKVAEAMAPLSAKKKREVLQTMPDSSYNPWQGNIVFTSVVSNEPNPCKERSPVQKSRVKKYLSQKVHSDMTADDKLEKTKKIRLSLDRLVSKNRQKSSDFDLDVPKSLSSPKIERRWSSVSSASWSEKKQGPYNELAVVQSLLKINKKLGNGLEKNYNQDDVFMDAEINLSDDNEANDQISEELMDIDSQKTKFSEFPGGIGSRDEEYVTIPKSEYEEIKNRVSAIESRISQEFGCISTNSEENLIEASASKVQSEYEKTLEEASIGTTATADHLAKRLSKELKIRRSAEHKIIRSPSARKIGNLRRRSQERPVSKRGNRHVSWLATKQSNAEQSIEELNNICPKANLKRGRPNTVYTGLMAPNTQLFSSSDPICSDETNARLDFLQKQLHTLITHTVEHTKGSLSDDEVFIGDRDDMLDASDSVLRSTVRRASSFHGSEFIDNSQHFNKKMKELKKSSSQQDVTLNNECYNIMKISGETSNDKNVKWKDANRYFDSDCRTCTPATQTGRASVAKLRTQNAGMVLAKAKLFDNTTKKEIGCGDKSRSNRMESNGGQSVKIGKAREVKYSELEASTVIKKSGTPRRKHYKSLKNGGNAKLKLLHSSGSSPLIKMELTIMPTHQNLQQDAEKRVKKHSGQNCDRQCLQSFKNDVKTEQNYTKSLHFNGNNFLCEKENKNIVLSPLERSQPLDFIHKETKRNILDLDSSSPCKTPHIKRPLTLKTPKDAKTLIRKQGIDTRRTPMRAVALNYVQLDTPRRQSPRSALKSKQLTRSVS